jgi:hypothetical protein
MSSKAKTPEITIDVNKVIESLTAQIAQQAQRIAMLEATIEAIKKSQQEDA